MVKTGITGDGMIGRCHQQEDTMEIIEETMGRITGEISHEKDTIEVIMSLGMTGDIVMIEISKLGTMEIRSITSVKEIIEAMLELRDRTPTAVTVGGNTGGITVQPMLKFAQIVNVRDIGRACAEEVSDLVFRTIEIKERRMVSGDTLDRNS